MFIEDEGEVHFTGKRITETVDDSGQRWHHMDQQRDIESFLEENGCVGVRHVGTRSCGV